MINLRNPSPQPTPDLRDEVLSRAIRGAVPLVRAALEGLAQIADPALRLTLAIQLADLAEYLRTTARAEILNQKTKEGQ